MVKGKGTKDMAFLIPAGIYMLSGMLILGGVSPAQSYNKKSPSVMNKKYMVVGKDISKEDIEDFYYTKYHMDYLAEYQRYRFYVEDGKNYFYHERREKDDYGPLTEEDITESGIRELTDKEWKRFYRILKNGTVKKRTESTETGSEGPWTYIYWKKDRSIYQEYAFPSVQAEGMFVEYCEKLAGDNG